MSSPFPLFFLLFSLCSSSCIVSFPLLLYFLSFSIISLSPLVFYLLPLYLLSLFPFLSPPLSPPTSHCPLSLPISSSLHVYRPLLISFFSFIVPPLTSSLLPIEQWIPPTILFSSRRVLYERKQREGKKKETDRCLKKKESRESNAKLKALWKALETAGCPGGNLKILPQETVKEKVWQSVWNMLYIHKGSENLIDSSTTLVSARFTVLYIVFSFTWLGFVQLFFKIMPWMWSLHSVFVCCFTLSVIQLVDVHVTHLSFYLFSPPLWSFPPLNHMVQSSGMQQTSWYYFFFFP